jgi:hypothetical protein
MEKAISDMQSRCPAATEEPAIQKNSRSVLMMARKRAPAEARADGRRNNRAAVILAMPGRSIPVFKTEMRFDLAPARMK